MVRPLLGVAAAFVGGFAIGRLGALETVLLSILGYAIARVSPGASGMACFLLGGAVGLVVARLPFEPSLSLAVRSVALNPVILVGFAVGARLAWPFERWVASPDAPAAASHPAQRPAGTRAAGSP